MHTNGESRTSGIRFCFEGCAKRLVRKCAYELNFMTGHYIVVCPVFHWSSQIHGESDFEMPRFIYRVGEEVECVRACSAGGQTIEEGSSRTPYALRMSP